ncbi:MAG: hypothetical protein JWM68_5236 [Verrucomicrobiales bacterium]|nr:hypothetical protein [Verrucomicrobiales bacterium]
MFRRNSLGFLLITVLLFVGCGKKKETTAASQFPAQANSGGYFKTPFQNESQYIVQNIITDIAEMAFYAKNRKLPDPKQFSVKATESGGSFRAPNYDVEIIFTAKDGPIKLQLPVNAVWSPEVYDGLTTAIFQKLQQTKNPTSQDGEDKSILISLTEGTASSIEEVNQAVSSALQIDFRNPGLHEQAAVVLGAFTLRENADEFCDYRWPLCRMTAHLALARQLNDGNPFGVNGQFAEVMLGALIQDQRGALAKLEKIDASDPYLARWKVVLHAFITGDYRGFKAEKDLELFEKKAWFEAACASIDPSTVWSKLKEKEMATVADYSRSVSSRDYSVSAGHQLLQVSLKNEIDEVNKVYALAQKKALATEKLVEALNVLPTRCFESDTQGTAKVQVLGWGVWANFLQRHLCSAVRNNYDFLEHKWGNHEPAASFATECEKVFGGLYLYPFVRRFNASSTESFQKAVNDCFVVTVAMPHLTPAECWNWLCYSGPNGEDYRPNPNPHINEWHNHNPPPGSVYNPYPRMNHPSLTDRADNIQVMEQLHQLAPYNRIISENLVKVKYKDKPTYEQYLEIYKPMMEFSIMAVAEGAKYLEEKPQEFEKVMGTAAEAWPTYYFHLADYFNRRKNEEKAAEYYKKGYELVTDRVLASYYADWLINYYLKNKQLDKAREVADEAGEVYSATGLEAKASFLEKIGEYNEAYTWFKNIKERYNDGGPLFRFCTRNKDKLSKEIVEKEVVQAMKLLFPKGKEQVTVASFKGAPKDGVDVLSENELVVKAGLKSGDIIVALDGIRVRNFPQYEYVRGQLPSPTMVFIVWNGSEYKETTTDLPGHRFNADFETHPQK